MTENFNVFYDPYGYTPLPNMICKARLMEVETGAGHYGQNFILTFSILYDLEMKFRKYIGCKIKDLISVKERATRNSKLGRLIKELAGLKKPANVKLSDLIGQECYIKIERTLKGNKMDYLRREDVERDKPF